MIKDIKDKKFGRWTVLKFIGMGKHRNSLWLCKCDCDGKEKIVPKRNLNDGSSKSCGCLTKERLTTHKLSKHYLYNTWHDMMKRCYNPRCKDYENYHSRKIFVCPEWHDIRNFVKYVEPIYVKGLTFHRIDNDKGYEPGNVTYATAKTQGSHKSTNHLITFNGKTQILSQWAEEIKISSNLLSARLNRLKWSTEKALTTPCRHFSSTRANLKKTKLIRNYNEFAFLGSYEIPLFRQKQGLCYGGINI